MSKDIVIIQPNEEAIRQAYWPLVQRAESLSVVDKASHEVASVLLVDIRRAKKIVGDRMDPIIKHVHQGHRGLTTLRKDLLGPLNLADEIITARLNVYEHEQRRIAQEAQAAAQAEAAKLEDERRLMEAIAAEEDGEDVDAVLDAPIEVPTIHVEPEISKVDGISSTTRYKAEVMDIILTLEHLTSEPCNWLSKDSWDKITKVVESVLQPLARAQREALRIPGVRVVKETGRSVRTA